MVVNVKLEYYGRFKKMAGKETEMIALPQNMKAAVQALKDFLKEEYGIEDKCMILSDSVHIIRAMKENRTVEPGHVFKIIPFLSGG